MMYLHVFCEKEKVGPGWRTLLAQITPEALAAGEECLGLYVPTLEVVGMSQHLLTSAKPLPYDPLAVALKIRKKAEDLPRQGITPDPDHDRFLTELLMAAPARVRTRPAPQPAPEATEGC